MILKISSRNLEHLVLSQPYIVASELGRFSELRRRLLELYPDVDEQTLADTLEGATNLREAVAALLRSALEDESLAKGLRTLLEAMKSRLSRLEGRAMSKRIVALETMQKADIQKFTEPDFTASLRLAPPSVLILNEAEIPAEFLIPQSPKIDRRGLLQALNDGAAIPGVALSNGRQTLSVRIQ